MNKNLSSMILGSAIFVMVGSGLSVYAQNDPAYLSDESAKPVATTKPTRPVLAADEEAAAKSYERALNFIYDEKWNDAVKAFEEHLKKFPKSQTQIASRYWLCYAKEHLEASAEKSFQYYMDFVRANPSSQWADQAQTNMVRLGHQLAKAGKPQYEAILNSMKNSEDEEVKMAALYALADTGDPNALPTIIKLYDQSKSQNFRVKIVHMLVDFDSPEATTKLTEIALTDPDKTIRGKEPMLWEIEEG
jgi:hypothetical protein